MAQFGNNRGNRQDYPFDESKFKPGQRTAAIMLVEKEFAPTKERITDEEIAEEAGTTRMTLYRWKTRDRNFINYKNYLAVDFVDSYLPLVYSKMVDGINNGSAKLIELYLKRIGDLDQRSEVTINEGANDQSYEDRKQELLARLGKESDEIAEEDVESESETEGGGNNDDA